MSQIAVRPALVQEADALSALCFRSKAHWGYDDEFMARSRRSLTISPEFIATGRVFVAKPEGCAPVGVASVAPLAEPGVYDLVHLFVEPATMLKGVGRSLFEAAANKAKAEHAHRLVIQSDPHAVGFYRRLGAIDAGEAPSESIPQRMLPVLHFKL